MTQKSIPLSSLLPPKGNPRRTLDEARIGDLAASIRADGVLQNLVVQPANGKKFRVIVGKRRYLALQRLRKEGAIKKDYPVPVEIRRDLPEDDAKRIATVENVQREPLEPIDEAEAFASLLQNGASVADVAVKAGLSEQTIRRRLALASLSEEIKQSVRSGELPLGIAEALTLGGEDKQREILANFRDGMELDRETVRDMLLSEKPTVAMAIFPVERYTGALTKDLFADAETTYFDDAEQFLALQREAVEELAAKHRENSAFVAVLNVWGVSWWHYREADPGETPGVVINLSPAGQVEIREGLARHQVDEQVAVETQGSPIVAKRREGYGATLLRYIGNHKSIAMQAALLGNPRKAKEVAAVLLLLGHGAGERQMRLHAHPCHLYFAAREPKPKAYLAVQAEADLLAEILLPAKRGKKRTGNPWQAVFEREPTDLHAAVKGLDDSALDRLVVFLICLCFGQQELEALDTGQNLFNEVAQELSLSMRDWWVPDEEFLGGLRREELAKIVAQSGASARIGRPQDYGKHKLVEALVKHFEKNAGPEAELDKLGRKARAWLPGAMLFPAKDESRT